MNAEQINTILERIEVLADIDTDFCDSHRLDEIYKLAHGFNTSYSCFDTHEEWRK